MNGQSLIYAQVNVNRAVFELNRKGYPKGHELRAEPRKEYILEQVEEAILELEKVKISITGQQKIKFNK